MAGDVDLDLGGIEPSVAGPRRPQDRMLLSDVPARFRDLLHRADAGGYQRPRSRAQLLHVAGQLRLLHAVAQALGQLAVVVQVLRGLVQQGVQTVQLGALDAAAQLGLDDATFRAMTGPGMQLWQAERQGMIDVLADAGQWDTAAPAVVAAVAHDTNASLDLAVYENGKQRVAFSFTTQDARRAELNLIEQKAELERTTDADHKRVLMMFTRTNLGHAKAGARSGERVRIEAIHGRDLPIVYASTLAEERIRHEIAEADDNVYKKAFDVDVNVEERDGKPIAYRIVGVHDVIDID